MILMTLNFNKIKKPSRLLLRTTYLAKYKYKYKYNIIILISNSETFYDQRAALPYNLSSLQLAVPCCVSGPCGSPSPSWHRPRAFQCVSHPLPSCWHIVSCHNPFIIFTFFHLLILSTMLCTTA
jgi:hypothetical protein